MPTAMISGRQSAQRIIDLLSPHTKSDRLALELATMPEGNRLWVYFKA